MKDPYAVLGLTRNADPEQIKSKYEELRAVYSEQRFKIGEEGNEGARKLQELEEAWAQINAELEVQTKNPETGGAPDFNAVDSLIREGKYNEAQAMLDGITDRKGEWHYMQSIIFYKRDWLTESKTQLEMALQDDPGNPKYRASLDKLNMAMNGNAANGQAYNNAGNAQYGGNQYGGNQYGGGANGGYNGPDPQQQPADNMSNCLSSCCCAYCLTDCLCSALRCM